MASSARISERNELRLLAEKKLNYAGAGMAIYPAENRRLGELMVKLGFTSVEAAASMGSRRKRRPARRRSAKR